MNNLDKIIIAVVLCVIVLSVTTCTIVSDYRYGQNVAECLERGGQVISSNCLRSN
jgi:hypothetical protein